MSPHRFELFDPDPAAEFPWAYYSENEFVGKKINVDMYSAIKAIEELTGKQFIYIEDIPKTSWEKNEDRLIAESEAEFEKYLVQKGKKKRGIEPRIHEYQEPPKWIEERMTWKKE